MIYLLIIILLVCASCAAAETTSRSKTIRLLTVGNSFSGNAVRYLPQLVEAAGHKLVLARADLGGCELHRHWRHVEAAENQPDSPDARPYTVAVDGKTAHRSLKEMLQSDKWDYVTIQQASMISSDITTYRPYAKNMRDYIKKYAPQAEVLMHETWAYRVDDPRFEDGKDSQKKMHSDLRKAYTTIANELGLRIMPVGEAMYAADTDPNWGYKPVKFEKASLKYPDLPDQTHSLHVGYRWAAVKGKPGERELTMDGHHASQLGCYLIGCVWFESLTGESVEGNKYIPRGISVSEARYLQSVAHRVVAGK